MFSLVLFSGLSRGFLCGVLTMFIQFSSVAQHIIYVDSSSVGRNTPKDGTSWETAFFDLKDAFAVADSGDQVWIAKGTYFPTQCDPCTEMDRLTSIEVPQNIEIIGGFKGEETSLDDRRTDSLSLFQSYPTRISGNIGSKSTELDNSSFLLNLSGPSKYSGLIIQDCYGDLERDYLSQGLICNAAQSEFNSCMFINNYFKSGYCHSLINIENGEEFNFTPTVFKECSFISNRGDKIIYGSNGVFYLEECYAKENDCAIIEYFGWHPGAGAQVKIKDSQFFDNTFIAYCRGDVDLDVSQCIIQQTDSTAFNIINEEEDPYLTAKFDSCTFQENKGTVIRFDGTRFFGGLFLNLLDSLSINNCLFKDNTGANRRVWVKDARFILATSNFFNNSFAIETRNSDVSIKYCLFNGNENSEEDAYEFEFGGDSGAAIKNVNSNSEVTYSRFVENTLGTNHVFVFEDAVPVGGGGAIYNNGGNHTLTNCDFERNKCYGIGGGAIFCDGADLQITDCAFTENISSDFDSYGGDGGGLYTFNGNTQVINCHFKGNSASFDGGGIFLSTGEESPFKRNWISNSRFENNMARYDGGGLHLSGPSTISTSSIYGNEAGRDGGGLVATGQSLIENSTLSGNTSSGKGGGAFNSGEQVISNTTISTNEGLEGGAIHSSNSLQVRYSTLADNLAKSFASSISFMGGDSDTLLLKNSIISGPTNLITISSESNGISQGYNLISDTTSSRLLVDTTDICGNSEIQLDPKIGPLGENGGPTQTHPLLIGSPCIGKGEPISSLELSEDQRGYSRTVGSLNASIDIGAFEYQESYIESPSFQICQYDNAPLVIEKINIIDSTGGAWGIGNNQEFSLEFPRGIQIINQTDVEIKTIGEGIDTVWKSVGSQSIKLRYDRDYTTSPNRIEISGIKLIVDLDPGTYNVYRSPVDDAIQNGNDPQDSVSHTQIWVIPSLDSTQLPYDDSFESDISLWQPDIDNSIWQRGTPNAKLVNYASTGQNAWVTHLNERYPSNIHTWLYSPCIDLTSLLRPSLSLDYWSEAEIGLDGTVLQASIDRGKTWHTVGTDTTGINWYDTNLLLSNPGNQPIDQQFGWTGEKENWLRASHRLPDSLNSPITRFRLAFRSSDFINPTKELKGFALDNFLVGERSQKVLLENFPSKDLGNFKNRLSILYPEFLKDIIPIVYPDEEVNHPDANARRGYYGISTSNIALLKGIDIFRPVNSLTYRALDTSSLQLSPFQIQIDTTIEDPFSVKVEVTALEAWDSPVDIHIALLENGVIHGSDTLDFILRKFLPGPQGIRERNWQKGETRHFTQTWSLAANPSPSSVDNYDSLHTVVFIQDPESREVFQAATSSMDCNFTVSSKSPIAEDIRIFPNPTQDKLYIQRKDFSQKIRLILRSIQGQVVETLEFPPNQLLHEWVLPNLAAGVYVLELQNQGKVLNREKIVISY